MKLKSILIGLILCLITVYCASCNIQSNGDDTSAPDVGTQDIQNGTSAGNDETTADITEDTTEYHEPAVDYAVLIIKDYDDFLKFGTLGELDAEKYEFADTFIAQWSFSQGAFTDCRDLLELEALPETGYFYEIIIQSKDAYDYFVYAEGENNRSVPQYEVHVRYDENLSVGDATYMDDTVYMNDPAEMKESSGTFVWRKDGKEMFFYKGSETEYGMLLMSFDHWLIGVNFERHILDGSGKTPAEIQELLGEKVASLFSEDAATVEATLNAIESELNGNG